jgi:hypothetical protein
MSCAESTRVHSGADRFDADGIGVFAPQSTNPPTSCAAEKHPYPPSRKDRAQGAGEPFEKDRNVAHHHARDSARVRVEHLLWAMDAGKDRDFQASNRGPLPIMTSPRGRKSRPWMGAVAFPSEIGARPTENLQPPEKEMFGRGRAL